jgi:hypothetical protein
VYRTRRRVRIFGCRDSNYAPSRLESVVSDPNIITIGTNHDIMFLFRLSLAYIGSFGAVL